MTRTGDIAPPAVTPHPLGPGSPMADWPYRPVIALERLPQAAYVWDDTDPAVVWDAPGPDRRFVFPGVAGNYMRVPDAANLDITGDIEIVVRAAATTWSTAAQQALVSKQGAYGFAVNISGTLTSVWFFTDAPGTSVFGTSTAHSFVNGTAYWMKITRVRATGLTSFYKAPDAPTEPTAWTAIGTATVGAGKTIVASTEPVTLAQRITTGQWPFAGNIARAIIRNGIGGPVVVDVDQANATGLPVGATSFTATTGQTVTVTQTAGNTIVQAIPGDYAYVWDAPFIAGGYSDASCDFHALELDPGDADDLYLVPATQCTVTLDNRSGAYTVWAPDGRLIYWAPGRRLHVLAVDDADTPTWLFSGRVSSWVVNADDTVTVTAFDGFATLAQELGGKWTPGIAGDTVTARITAICSAAGYTDRVDVDAGNVTLTAPELAADVTPLEALERVALSDGGRLYGDADGSIDYRNRTWRAGRADQTKVWAVSDNVCTVPVVVWDPELAADDDRLATDVRLVNTAGLVATAALAPGSSLWAGDASYRLTHPDPDQWSTQGEGNALAQYLLSQQSTPAMAMSRFTLYVQDPRQQPDVWDFAVDVRRGDLVEVLHEYPDPDGNPAFLDTYAIVLDVGHSITPEEWVVDVALSRTVDYRVLELWDRTRFTWDDPAVANVWRF